MKRMLILLLVFAMTLSMAACANGANGSNTTGSTTEVTKSALTDSLETIIEKITTEQPVEFAPITQSLDLTDTSEEGLWAIKSYTGLDNAEQIKEAAVFEPMIGSLPFSMVLVRVKDAAHAKDIAEQMKTGIDPRKWICVEADDVMVAGYGDVVMHIMVSSDSDVTAQSFVDAFQTVCGSGLDFTLA